MMEGFETMMTIMVILIVIGTIVAWELLWWMVG